MSLQNDIPSSLLYRLKSFMDGLVLISLKLSATPHICMRFLHAMHFWRDYLGCCEHAKFFKNASQLRKRMRKRVLGTLFYIGQAQKRSLLNENAAAQWGSMSFQIMTIVAVAVAVAVVVVAAVVAHKLLLQYNNC